MTAYFLRDCSPCSSSYIDLIVKNFKCLDCFLHWLVHLRKALVYMCSKQKIIKSSKLSCISAQVWFGLVLFSSHVAEVGCQYHQLCKNQHDILDTQLQEESNLDNLKFAYHFHIANPVYCHIIYSLNTNPTRIGSNWPAEPTAKTIYDWINDLTWCFKRKTESLELL